MAMASRKLQFKSISLPPRSHPSTLRLEEALTKLKTFEISPTFVSIYQGLLGLEDIFTQVHDLIDMPLTQQVLSLNRDGKCFDEILDESVKLLDICSCLIDMMVQVKEHVQCLRSVLRRRKGDSCIETKLAEYASFRKMKKKYAKNFIATLKQMENKDGSSSLLDQNHHLSAVIRVLREVNTMISSVFQSVSMLLATPVGSTQSRNWSLVSKLTRKVNCEEKHQQNDIEVVDAVLLKSDRTQDAQKKLEEFEISIQDIGNCLESVFRCMIKARVGFLNIISQ